MAIDRLVCPAWLVEFEFEFEVDALWPRPKNGCIGLFPDLSCGMNQGLLCGEAV